MSKITQIKLWKDIGYQEGSVEVPSKKEQLLLPDLTIEEDIAPQTGLMFSSFTVPYVFKDFLQYSYLKVTYDFNNSQEDLVLYGWIDNVLLKSDTDEKPSVTVNWHVDLWRSYINQATFGYGIVQSRPVGGNPAYAYKEDPPQSLSARYRLPGDFTSLAYTGKADNLYWIVLNRVYESDDHKVTTTRSMVMPVSSTSPTQSIKMKLGTNGTAYPCPSLQDFILGKFDEILGLSPTTVSSVYVTPIPPFEVEEYDTRTATVTIRESAPATESDWKWVDTTGENRSRYGTDLGMFGESTTQTVFGTKYSDGGQEAVIYYNDQKVIDFIESYSGTLMPKEKNWASTDIDLITGNITIKENMEFFYHKTVNQFIRENIGDEWNNLSDDDEFILGGGGALFCTDLEYDLEVAPHSSSVIRKVSGTVKALNVSGSARTYVYSGYYGAFVNADTASRDDIILLTDKSQGSWTLRQKQSDLSYSIDKGTSKYKPEGGTETTYGYVFTTNGNYFEHNQSLVNPIVTTDTTEWVFTDMSGLPLGTLPWGIKCQKYTVRNVISATSGYIEYRFNGKDSASTGTSFVVPLNPVDLTSNSWSDYVYSGQREYDVTQRDIAAKQALVSSLTSTVTGGTSNAIMGGIGGIDKSQWENWVTSFVSGGTNGGGIGDTRGLLTQMYGRSPNALKSIAALDQAYSSALYNATPPAVSFGAGKALGASLGAGLVTAGAEYLAAQYFNGKLQKAEDMLQAKQLDSVLLSGNGWDFLWHGRPCGFVSMVADDYSLERFWNDKELNGIYCSEPTEDCTPLIEKGGPLQIGSLRVGGPIPVEARDYIRTILGIGVRIVDHTPDIPVLDTYTLVKGQAYNGYHLWYTAYKGYQLWTTPDETIPGLRLTFSQQGPMVNMVTGTPSTAGTWYIEVNLKREKRYVKVIIIEPPTE